MALDLGAARRVEVLLAGPIDWTALIETARVHRVVPLVYRTLVGMRSERIPADVSTRLRAEFRANARENLRLTAELLRVIDLLSGYGIPVIPYKGPALATSVYGDLSLRQFDDLDVILRSDDVAKANEVLAAEGYEVVRNVTGKDVALFHPTLGVTLEIHWSISAEKHPVQIAPDRLWQNLQRCSIGGRSVLTQAPEDLLWMLCIHGAQHRWERLSWLCDVAEMVRGNAIDWDRAMENATDLGAGRVLFLGLMLARDLLGTDIPVRAARAIESDRVLDELAERVKEWMAAPSSDEQRLGEAERYYVALGGRLGDRLRIAFKQVTPYLAPTDRDKERLRLPPYLSWLLYVVRPIRLTRSYGLTPLRRLLKGLFKS
jgi:hypothetical protein